ncbi:tRNA pseudouridine synthase family protein [Cryptosporidium serpentis]
MELILPRRTYCMAIGYNGTDYYGMQIQSNTNDCKYIETIESKLEEALIKSNMLLIKKSKDEYINLKKFDSSGFLTNINWTRVGRTDKGVHSVCQIVSFRGSLKVSDNDLKEELNIIMKYSEEDLNSLYNKIREYNTIKNPLITNPLLNNCNNKKNMKLNKSKKEFLDIVIEETIQNYLVKKLNLILPQTIRIFTLIHVSKHFDARKDCSRRQYEYIMPEYALYPVKFIKQDLYEKLQGIVQSRNIEIKNNFKSKYKKKRNRDDLINEYNYCKDEDIDENNNENDQDLKELRIKRYNQHELLRSNNYNLDHYPYIEKICFDEIEKYELNELELERFSKILNQYTGTHNFHNFTSRLKYNNASAWRHIDKINVNRLPVKNGLKLLKITIKGQSFLLHQIRKIIALAIEIYRGSAPLSSINLCFGSRKYSIHLAPSQGLLLDRVYYDNYNQRINSSVNLNDFNIPHLIFDDLKLQYVKLIEEFKINQIYPVIEKCILDGK